MHFESAKDKSVLLLDKEQDEPNICTLNRQKTKAFAVGQTTRQAQCAL